MSMNIRCFTILAMTGLCGCATSWRNTTETGNICANRITAEETPLSTAADLRYGHPGYASLIAHHNGLAANAVPKFTKLDLPDIDSIILAMPELKAHQKTTKKLLAARKGFLSLLLDLRKTRGKTAPGVDKEVSAELARSLGEVVVLFESAAADIALMRMDEELYPERVDTSIMHAVDEIRRHASGRYYGRPISSRQTEQSIARIFDALLVWQKVLSGEIPIEKMKFPRCACG